VPHFRYLLQLPKAETDHVQRVQVALNSSLLKEAL
jgi:hypothetical protein